MHQVENSIPRIIKFLITPKTLEKIQSYNLQNKPMKTRYNIFLIHRFSAAPHKPLTIPICIFPSLEKNLEDLQKNFEKCQRTFCIKKKNFSPQNCTTINTTPVAIATILNDVNVWSGPSKLKMCIIQLWEIPIFQVHHKRFIRNTSELDIWNSYTRIVIILIDVQKTSFTKTKEKFAKYPRNKIHPNYENFRNIINKNMERYCWKKS